jgi:PAS domain S-box-containing protein
MRLSLKHKIYGISFAISLGIITSYLLAFFAAIGYLDRRNNEEQFKYAHNALKAIVSRKAEKISSEAKFLSTLPILHTAAEIRDHTRIVEIAHSYQLQAENESFAVLSSNFDPIVSLLKGEILDDKSLYTEKYAEKVREMVQSSVDTALFYFQGTAMLIGVEKISFTGSSPGYIVIGELLTSEFARRLQTYSGIIYQFTTQAPPHEKSADSPPPYYEVISSPQLSALFGDDPQHYLAQKFVVSDPSFDGALYYVAYLPTEKSFNTKVVVSEIILSVGLLIFLASLLLYRLTLLPHIHAITKLREFTNQITESNNLSARTETIGSDEIAGLGRHFNRLLDRIQETMVSQKDIENIIDSISDFLLVIDSNGKCRRANQHTLQRLGYTANEIAGKHIDELLLINLGDEPGHKGALHYESILQLKEKSAKGIVRRKDGQQIAAFATWGFLRHGEGSLAGSVIIAKDMSEIAHVQELLLQTAKMSAFGQMAGEVAHEINNPNAIIIGRAFQMRSLLSSNSVDTNEFLTYVDDVDDSAKRIAKIISRMQSFAEGHNDEEIQRTDLNAIVSDTLTTYGAKFRKFPIKVQFKPAVATYVDCRRKELSQVIHNLINYSLETAASQPFHAIKPNATIRIKVSNDAESALISIGYSEGDVTPVAASKAFFSSPGLSAGNDLNLQNAGTIILSHGGKFYHDPGNLLPQFVFSLPVQKTPSLT